MVGRLGFRTMLATVALCALTAPTVLACPVCFGAVESPMTDGMNWAIFLLLGVLATVATGFVMFFVRLFKLARVSAESATVVRERTQHEGSY
jgi:drug/metabolite transporter (DMT)-like permease